MLKLYLVLIALLIFKPAGGCKTSGNDMPIKWELTFEDNFNTFDTTKWITEFPWETRTIWSNKELQWYMPENVSVKDGKLQLTTVKKQIYGKDVESEKQFEYTSGMICSSESFVQPYGKWEIRVKFPFRKGFWPAFWLLPEQRPTLPEVDVFEYFGIDKNQISSTLHWGIDYPNYETGKYYGLGEPFYYVKSSSTEGDFADRWMVWEFECLPNKATWKLDGKVVFEMTEGIPTAPMFMIANVAVKDHEQNNKQVDDSNSPYVMEIDYIRVYKMVPSN
ncbi:MAG: glycoside hydrolase family 16 protein [Ignavibacteriaceae bacterium]|jgi:beta-glucanase (GH16 family)|nr:MAG: glycoside hydrolase family 16 protein [Chlorobiota bacterium]KXK06355.1 MAG: glycoside hydrolase family 16 [Chlorobi bacterium OLB4]MBV6399132.1 Glucan endo-1,3-beta-glucosidase A1 [Ignavibacteria bacterium]MCC6885421.1 glycoside hydrolase family 16 protein [Ignavibacteriales bacterium]MCE7953664.1 glycoside hydrolase family 16 protein [Chlorobi bacterium CHB7]MDL1887447.1 glycoside hydrolase family 16 protein [Ignavibacteria bacterium CHB1]MEB2329920.1 glycoside hydrolase family 16 p